MSMPDHADEYEDAPLLTEAAQVAWVQYLNQWDREVYDVLFRPREIGRDAALIVWFVNRLRNAIPDDDAGNDPWKG
jgi:hypothetical protein